jgi:hypothetical protein
MKTKALLLFCLLLPLGCRPATSTTPPAALTPGALNQYDQDFYLTLSAAHGFALSAAAQAQVLSPAQKAALNQFITSLNAADLLYAEYHTGAATQASMQSSLNSVSTAEANYSKTITTPAGGK